jgi:hypothetical protein
MLGPTFALFCRHFPQALFSIAFSNAELSQVKCQLKLPLSKMELPTWTKGYQATETRTIGMHLAFQNYKTALNRELKNLIADAAVRTTIDLASY